MDRNSVGVYHSSVGGGGVLETEAVVSDADEDNDDGEDTAAEGSVSS